MLVWVQLLSYYVLNLMFLINIYCIIYCKTKKLNQNIYEAWRCAITWSPLIWSAVDLRTEIRRNYRSSLDFGGGKGIRLMVVISWSLDQPQLKSDQPRRKELAHLFSGRLIQPFLKFLYSIRFLLRLRLREETRISEIFSLVGGEDGNSRAYTSDQLV